MPHMTSVRPTAPLLRRIAELTVLSLAFIVPVSAQGLSYDMKSTAQGMDPRSGSSVTRTMMAGHGQFVGGNARLDFTESAMPGGMMGSGMYMIVKNASSISTFVDPAKKQYFELDRADLAKTATAAQQATSGLVKTDLSDLVVTSTLVGPGEPIEGYATMKYRITDAYTMTMSVMGQTSKTSSHSTTDLWVAPALSGLMNPMMQQSGAASGPTAALTTELTKAYAKIGKGVVLRMMRTDTSMTGDKTRTTTISTEISNIKRTSISPTVFDVPTGYTKSDGALGMGMFKAMADSARAARAKGGKPVTRP